LAQRPIPEKPDIIQKYALREDRGGVGAAKPFAPGCQVEEEEYRPWNWLWPGGVDMGIGELEIGKLEIA
jgi:hypothetical protein